MIHFELCYKKYHRSIIKNVIKASQKRHEAFLIAKLPTLQEVPKNRRKRLRVYTIVDFSFIRTFAP